MAKKIIITIITVILLGLGLYFAYDYYVSYKIGFTNIYVASHNIAQRTKITIDDIEIIKVPKDFINEDVLIDKNEIIDKYVKLSYSIPKGSLIYKNYLEDDIKDLANTLLFDNQVTYDLYVSDAKINTAHLSKGMYIDIYLTIDKKDKVISDLILQDCRITGFYDGNGKEILDYDRSTRIMVVSLAINKEDVSLLNKAMVIGSLNTVVKSNTYICDNTSKQNTESILFDYLS